jgi:hypothetical protein
MNSKVSLFALVAGLASLTAASAADITGKVTLKGTPPPAPNMPLKADPNCGKLVDKDLPMPFYVVGAGGELAETFIYLKEGVTGKDFPVPAEPVVLDQIGCQYKPYVFGIRTKQKLLVKNSDPVMHNVHVVPKGSGNKESNQAQMAKGPDIQKTFDSPEIFMTFKCDVHPWMFAYANVMDHPYWAVSGADGSFKISNVPAGKYVIEAFHRKGGKVTKEITVGSDNQSADFAIELKPTP